MIVSIGNDHAGVDLKNVIKQHLIKNNIKLINKGTNSEDSVDYPDFIHPVAKSVSNNESELGIIICGTGNGANMTANKHKDIRSALCWNVEIAKLARQHNNANIISLPSRFIRTDEAIKILETFLNTSFEGGRHQQRVEKISDYK